MRSHHLIAILTAGAVAVGATAAVAQPAQAVRPPDPPSRAALVDAAQAVVAAGVPGVVVETHDSYGTRTITAGVGDVRTGSPPTGDGKFRIGSVTKTFTATVVLDLVADGVIRLDAPVRTELPGLLPYARPITVRQLLSHRSGLFDYEKVVWATPKLALRDRFRPYRPTQLVRIATEHPLVFKPGARFGYSDTDYIVLGLLIERVTGHSFDYELVHRVLRPAGLSNTYLAGHDPRLPHAAERGFERIGPTHQLTDLTAYDMSVAWASGGMVSTAADLNRFYAGLLDGTLLPGRELREMEHARHAFPGFGYGLGIGHAVLCGQDVWGHVGGVAGFDTYSFTSPDSGRQITIFANRSLTLREPAEAAISGLMSSEFCGAGPPQDVG